MTFERAARGLLLWCGLAMATCHLAGLQAVPVGFTGNHAIHLGFILALLFLDSTSRSGSAVGRIFGADLGRMTANRKCRMMLSTRHAPLLSQLVNRRRRARLVGHPASATAC